MPEAECAVLGRIESGYASPALMLTHHLDVVPAEASEWNVAPFAGGRKGEYIVARGALDAKSLGVAQAIAMMNLARRGGLKRDVVFLAVPDEETGGRRGILHLARNEPEKFENLGLVLGEGGSNTTVVDSVTWWGIEVDQKIPLWIEVVVEGGGGHGAGGGAGTAPEVLLDILAELRAIDSSFHLTESSRAYFASLAESKVERAASVLRAAAGNPSDESVRALPSPQRSVVERSMAVTRLHAGSGDSSPNVIPGRAVATIDFRLPSGVDPAEFLAEIEAIVENRASLNILLRGESVPASKYEGEAWKLLTDTLQQIADVPVGPLVIPGTTDLRVFRAMGIEAWGFSPFELNYYDGATIHSANERLRERQFLEGIDVMKDVALTLATSSEW